MSYRIVLYTRATLTGSPSSLVSNSDKRSGLLKRFDYASKVTIKKIAGDTITLDELKTFYNSVKDSLNDSDLIVFVDEKSFSALDKTEIEAVIAHVRDTLIGGGNVDVFYFANSMDNCQTRTLLASGSGTIDHFDFYESKAPNGFYAVGSTKLKWNTIFEKMDLRDEIKATGKLSGAVLSKELKAGTAYPRIFVPNISMISDDSVETFFTHPCRIEEEFGRTLPNTEYMASYWFILGLILVIVFVWIMTKFAPRHRVYFV